MSLAAHDMCSFEDINMFRDIYNDRFGFDQGSIHTLNQISITTGYELKGLNKIFDKGYKSYITLPNVALRYVDLDLLRNHEGMERVYQSVVGGPTYDVDKKLLKYKPLCDRLKCIFKRKKTS